MPFAGCNVTGLCFYPENFKTLGYHRRHPGVPLLRDCYIQYMHKILTLTRKMPRYIIFKDELREKRHIYIYSNYFFSLIGKKLIFSIIAHELLSNFVSSLFR